MCINMKLGCKFCVDQVALEQHHFDIHDLTTAMEWSTPKLTDTTFPPSATFKGNGWSFLEPRPRQHDRFFPMSRDSRRLSRPPDGQDQRPDLQRSIQEKMR